MKIRAILADDHTLVREGLKGLLVREGIEVVAEAADGREAVAQAKKEHPDIAVLDIFMPLLNGLEAAREIHRSSPKVKTLLLTMYKDEQYILEALKAGVHGYVLKSQAARDLVHAVQEVMQGNTYLSPAISGAVVTAYLRKGSASASASLTTRERAVLQLIAEGKSTKDIAQSLDIAVKTADSHRTKLMKKLDIHEIAGLVRYAIRHGIIQA